MRAFENWRDRKQGLRWFLGATGLFFVLSRFVPHPPRMYHEMDDAYMLVLHEAFRHSWQFGRDIIFAFGPWGFLAGGFHPDTFVVSAIVWAALALVFWWSGWRIARHFFDCELMAWIWVLSFAAVSGATIFLNIDVRLTGFAVLLLLLHFFVEDKRWSAMQAVLTVSLGLLSLIKFGQFILASAVVLAMTADTVIRCRRFPWVLLAFAGSVLSFWVLAGQHLSSFPPFLTGSWQITSGYTEAMMLTRVHELRDVGFFVASTTLLCALLAYAAWIRLRFVGVIPVGGFAFILFTAFKYGYVRHDGHEVTAVLQLLLVSLGCFALLWPRAKRNGWWAMALNFVPVLAVYLFAASTSVRYSKSGLGANLARGFRGSELRAPIKLVSSGRQRQKAYDEFLDKSRRELPLPLIKGSVDVYPWNQIAVLAHGLDYLPRPSIQSCNAYTPELAGLNAAFLRSERAPDNILFELWTIDDRFPSLDDALSWPELLTRYDVMEELGNFVRLQRRAEPRTYEMIPLGEASFEFGAMQPVPSIGGGPIWVEMEIAPTLTGKIASFFYKPPILQMTVTLKEGRRGPYRIVPAMARSGFLISPMPQNTKSFALLSRSEATAGLADSEVASLSVSAATQSGHTSCYQSPIRLRFYRLSISETNGTGSLQ